jgi:hypothetical protein
MGIADLKIFRTPKNGSTRIGLTDNPNDSKDNFAADIESDIKQDNGIDDPEFPVP